MLDLSDPQIMGQCRWSFFRVWHNKANRGALESCEIFQDFLLELVKREREGRGWDPDKAGVFTYATWVARSVISHAQRDVQTKKRGYGKVDYTEDLASLAPSDGWASARRMEARIDAPRVLGMLSDDQSEMVQRVHLGGEQMQVLAREEGISRQGIQHRWERAKDRVARQLLG